MINRPILLLDRFYRLSRNSDRERTVIRTLDGPGSIKILIVNFAPHDINWVEIVFDGLDVTDKNTLHMGHKLMVHLPTSRLLPTPLRQHCRRLGPVRRPCSAPTRPRIVAPPLRHPHRRCVAPPLRPLHLPHLRRLRASASTPAVVTDSRSSRLGHRRGSEGPASVSVVIATLAPEVAATSAHVSLLLGNMGFRTWPF